jgi:hypothetical protein
MLHPQNANTEKGLQIWRIDANMLNKQDEMGEACSMHGRESECISDFGGKS